MDLGVVLMGLEEVRLDSNHDSNHDSNSSTDATTITLQNRHHGAALYWLQLKYNHGTVE